MFQGGVFDSPFLSQGRGFVHKDCPRGGEFLPLSSRVKRVCPRGDVLDEKGKNMKGLNLGLRRGLSGIPNYT